MNAYLDRLTDADAVKFADKIGDVFKTLPKLSDGLLEFLVKVAPYLALVGAILSVAFGPLVGVFGTFWTVLSLNPLFLVSTLITIALMLVQAVLLFMAFNPLQNREQKGWMLLFWSVMVNVVQTIFDLGTNFAIRSGSLILTVIFVGLSFYILFQLRPKYRA